MVNNVVSPELSWLDKIKSWINLDAVMAKLDFSKANLTEMILYLGIGFLSGFLVKKYSSYIFVVVLMIVGLVILQQYDVIMVTINWDKVQSVFGIQQATLVDENLFLIYWDWIKLNFTLVLSFSVGFLVGLRVG